MGAQLDPLLGSVGRRRWRPDPNARCILWCQLYNSAIAEMDTSPGSHWLSAPVGVLVFSRAMHGRTVAAGLVGRSEHFLRKLSGVSTFPSSPSSHAL